MAEWVEIAEKEAKRIMREASAAGQVPPGYAINFSQGTVRKLVDVKPASAPAAGTKADDDS